MAKKRGRDEGSVFKRKDGRWCAVVNLGWEGDRRRRKYVYGETRQEVAEQLTKALRDRQQGLPVVTERQTLAQFLDHWLENTVRPAVRPRTYQSYELLARLHLTPALGRIQLERLAPQHVEALLSAKSKVGLASQTVRHCRTVLRRALGHAQKLGLVVRNVATLVAPPRLERRRNIQVLSGEQARQLLGAAEGDRLHALFTIALTLGLRRGELLGLRWTDVDLDAGRIAVAQSVQRYKGNGLQASEPKTGRSRRVLSLPQTCVRALRVHRVRQLEERLIAGADWIDTGFIFTSTIGTPIDPRNLHRAFKAALLKAGLAEQVRFHDLRHACATYLLSQGLPLRTIADLLGHSSITVTSDIYAHVAPQMLEDAARKMDALLGG